MGFLFWLLMLPRLLSCLRPFPISTLPSWRVTPRITCHRMPHLHLDVQRRCRRLRSVVFTVACTHHSLRFASSLAHTPFRVAAEPRCFTPGLAETPGPRGAAAGGQQLPHGWHWVCTRRTRRAGEGCWRPPARRDVPHWSCAARLLGWCGGVHSDAWAGDQRHQRRCGVARGGRAVLPLAVGAWGGLAEPGR